MSYPWKNLSPKDTLILTRSEIISDLDVSTVLSLYQPLMGLKAASLYLAIKEILSASESKELPLSDILSHIDLGIREYYEARIKLEAYGLVKVYRHRENEEAYLIIIESPLTPKQFFNDTMLKMMLTEKLGERLVSDLKAKYLKTSHYIEKYKEITKSFHEVIDFNMENHFDVLKTTDIRDQQDKPSSLGDNVLKESDFDWEFFLAGLNKHFISPQSLTSDVKKLIETFHLIYSINELTMQKIVLESADITSGEISEKQLTRVVHQRFLGETKKHKNERNHSRSEDKRARQLKAKGFKQEEIEILLHAEKTQPYAYLKSIKQQKGGYVTSNERWLLKELVERSPLTTSVINILMNYILIVKNAPMLEKNLANKIANDWAQSDVVSPEDAMLKVKGFYDDVNEKNSKKQYRSKKSYKSNVSSRRETLPSWAMESEEKDERLSQEEEEAFREKLKKIRQQKSGDK
ncbi:replication initiation and membrane attachment family protein [Alkalibacterium kapii]|uniref:Replication initiation and membrane attachment n=1 Tax=Alkalibacterium kapii TaxID=426704 RepID=A0A511B0V0_9LACT|nr:DnaD domain protein [Alkalibacterium kapii]GEK91437.1 replication initiation and membrane attachment [Alkalibacterium kapii]